MRGVLMMAAAVSVMATSAWAADNQQAVKVTAPPPFAADANVQPVELTKVVVKLRKGQPWARIGYGRSCGDVETLTWQQETKDIDDSYFNDLFQGELAKTGVKVADGNLFEDVSTSTNLEIGAVIKDLSADFCAESRKSKREIGAYAEMTVEWQVYDRLKREVVVRMETKGVAEGQDYSSAVVTSISDSAFRENARQLLSDPAFRKTITASVGLSQAAAHEAAAGAPIALKTTPQSRAIGEAAGSVVTVFAGRDMGSGFLVSSDGYLLTNDHVVGAAKVVKVRWSDGVETLGEVVRSHKQRDVALIKTDPHNRTPLTLRRGAVAPGEAVFALGSPMDPQLQNTLTKGIVSANRTLDGQSYVQSDVAISPGNSGGPLLDEKGEVVAMTVAGVSVRGAMVGLNFFIPIGEALDVLALKPQS